MELASVNVVLENGIVSARNVETQESVKTVMEQEK